MMHCIAPRIVQTQEDVDQQNVRPCTSWKYLGGALFNGQALSVDDLVKDSS